MSAVDELLNPKKINFTYVDAVIEKADEETPLEASPIDAFHNAGNALVRHPVAIHYISDNGGYPDTAGPEIRVRLRDAGALFQTLSGKPSPSIDYHDIPAQDPFAAAFDLAQLARGSVRGFGNVFFANCAPRRKQRGKEDHNGGEKIYAGVLPNGAVIAGTGPDVFAHFKDLAKAGQLNIYEADGVATNHTQFRSRDYFPWLALVIGTFVNRPEINHCWRRGLSVAQRDELLFKLNVINKAKKLDPSCIPDFPADSSFVARADVHGNLKLGLRYDALKKIADKENEAKFVLYANGKILNAVIATNSFDKSDGITALSGGSSGLWKNASGDELSPFTEIFTVNGCARSLLELSDVNLRNGAIVHIVPGSLFHAARKELAKIKQESLSEARAADLFVSNGWVRGLQYDGLKKFVTEQKRLVDLLRPSPMAKHISHFPSPTGT